MGSAGGGSRTFAIDGSAVGPRADLPAAGLIQDPSGNLYGTTQYGGDVSCESNDIEGCGAVFRVNSSGGETVLYSFTGGADGMSPSAGLLRDSDGNMYGTTVEGGTNNFGAVFELNSSGTETVLYSFTGGADGEYPYAGVIQDKLGNLYGTASIGGANNGGTLFELDPSGTLTVLYTFNSKVDGRDGEDPEGDLLLSPAGNLYGVRSHGGAHQSGVVFEIVM